MRELIVNQFTQQVMAIKAALETGIAAHFTYERLCDDKTNIFIIGQAIDDDTYERYEVTFKQRNSDGEIVKDSVTEKTFEECLDLLDVIEQSPGMVVMAGLVLHI